MKFLRFGACVKFKRGEIIDETGFKVEFKKHDCDFKTIYGIIILGKLFVPYWFSNQETKYSKLAKKNGK